LITVRRALLSAYHKEGLEHLASALVDVGAEILSTGGTAHWLTERGFPIQSLEARADLPSLFGGRVKTLHPKVHGGILFRRGERRDEEERRAYGIEAIDLVAIDLYPFVETVRKNPSAWDEAIEMIDIGGPAMIRSAAKNHRSVAVICDAADFDGIAKMLKANKGSLGEGQLQELAAKAFRTTGCYDAAVAAYMERKVQAPAMPESYLRGAPLLWTLRYGENPSQRAAYYGQRDGFPGGLEKLQGKEISFNNLQDLEVAVDLVSDLGAEPAAVVVKHATPCGAAIGETIEEAYRLAHASDSLSAFGGIVALNRPVTERLAESIGATFLEVVAAPSFEEAAQSLLSKKKNLRLLAGDSMLHSREWGSNPYRSLGNGILVQDYPPDRLGEDNWRIVTEREPTEEEQAALRFAWQVVRMVRSNGIVFSGPRQVYGIGGGQTSRIDAVKIGILKARREGHNLIGSVMTSDSFFPFPDCVEEAASHGVAAIIQPGGSKRDPASIEAADRHGMSMVMNDARCFRHG